MNWPPWITISLALPKARLYILRHSMFYHIVTVTNNNIMGFQNRMPWHIRPETNIFKEIVKDETIIMSRNTAQITGNFWNKNRNLIVSKQSLSLKEALSMTYDDKRTFIIGGQSIFEQTLEVIEGIWITKLCIDCRGDSYYPRIPADMLLKSKHNFLMEDGFQQLIPIEFSFYEREWKKEEDGNEK